MMYVNFENDNMYPIKIEDGWGGAVYVHIWTLKNDKEWNEFIKDLTEKRKIILEREEEN